MKVRFIDCGPNIRDHWLAIKPSYPVPVDINPEQSPADLAGLLEGYDVCITDHTRLDASLLERCGHRLKHVIYFGTGAASIVDLPVADRLGIHVHTIRNYGDRTVAEHTIALLMAAARQIGAQHASLRAGHWTKLPGIELKGKRLGVVGLGAIGQEVASIGAALGLDVLAWSRSGAQSPHGRNVALDTLLADADIVTLHLALNEDTRGFMNATRLAQMKPGAILVNTARGALVDEGALLDALHSGALGHAALDVFEHEPLTAGSPWVSAPNVTLTAHCGYWTESATRNQVHMVLDIVSNLQG